MRRRELLRAAARSSVLVACLVACDRLPGIPTFAPVPMGLLGSVNAKPELEDVLVRALAEYGWLDGQNISIIRRTPATLDDAPSTASGVVNMGVRLIVAEGPVSIAAAIQATRSVPIVMVEVPDAVATGFVASFAHPGGNVTGSSGTAGPQIWMKAVELLARVAPGARHLAVVATLDVPGNLLVVDAVKTAAASLGLTAQEFDVPARADIDAVLATIRRWGADVLYVQAGGAIFSLDPTLPERIAQYRWPAVYNLIAFVQNGGLMAYHASEAALFQRAAYYVDRILRGANPGDLPVEQPSVFDLAVNRTTLSDLGLSIPPDLAAQVTEWIG